MNSTLPDSAISSWSGFVYQGKVALFHSITLLISRKFHGLPVPLFQLQLDSTDDFSIYASGSALSVHQVKAKSSPYRSAFVKALNKSIAITKDCTPATRRYFHIANPIDDPSDHADSSGVIVEFYKYGSALHCKLDEIEDLTKRKIGEYLEMKKLPVSPMLIDKKYCHLSELISTHVVKVHAMIHAGMGEDKAAYTQVIECNILEKIICADYKSEIDVPYLLKELRLTFASAFEGYVATNDGFTQNQIDDLGFVLRYVYQMDDQKLHSVMHSLRPSDQSGNIREDDVQNYMDIVAEISRSLVLAGLPHYAAGVRRYLPTSLILSNRKKEYFKDSLLKNIRLNPRLANVLYEYNTLITGVEDHDEINVRGSSDHITDLNGPSAFKNNIVREFPISVISRKIAKGELDV